MVVYRSSGRRTRTCPSTRRSVAGDFVFVSGQVAKDENGTMISAPSSRETRGTIEAIRRVLEVAGCGLEHVVKATVYLEDARDFGRYNGVFKEYFPEGRLARTTVEARAGHQHANRDRVHRLPSPRGEHLMLRAN